MKIRKIQIAAFGKLNGFTLDMSDGFHVLYGVNEAGKSTLMCFIRVMFYGFNKNARKDNLAENDRERFRPWHSPLYGGSVLFEHEGSLYSLERTFGATKAKDTVKLTNDITGKERRLSLPDEPGSELFGLGKTEFLNTVFVRQLGSVVDEDENIKAKLVALAAGNSMQVSADSMVEALLDKRKKIYSDRKNSQSEMSLLEEKLNALQEERAEAFRKEQLRKNLAEEIETEKARMDEKDAGMRLSEMRLEASRRLEEVKSIDEILSLNPVAEQYREQAQKLQKNDPEGRPLPSPDDIRAVREQLAKMLAVRGNVTMLHAQETAARTEKMALPDENEIAGKLDALGQAEEAFKRLEQEGLAIKEASDSAVRAFGEEDRELEREFNRLTMEAGALKTAFGEKYAGLTSTVTAAGFRRSELLNALERQRSDRERAISDLQYRMGEDTRRLADIQNQIETTKRSIPDLEAKEKWLEGRLAAGTREIPASGNPARKPAIPILIAVGILLVIAGVAGLITKSPVWPWIALATGAGALGIALLLAFTSRDRRNTNAGTDTAALREGWSIELQSIVRQRNGNIQTLQSLEQDSAGYRRRVERYQIDIDQYNGNAEQPETDRKASEDIREADFIIARAEEDMSSLKVDYDEKKKMYDLALAELAGKRAEHTYVPSDELLKRQAQHEQEWTAWLTSLPQIGAGSREELGKIREQLLAQKTAHSEKDMRIKALSVQLDAARRDEERLLDGLKQISGGYFFSSDIDEVKTRIEAAEERITKWNDLMTDIRHIEDKIGALSGGKSAEEIEARKAENRMWLDCNEPEAVVLSDEEKSRIKRELNEGRAGLQNRSLELGRKNSELSRLERESRLPAEIEDDIKVAREQAKLCRSHLNSIDLAVSMIRDTDEEMRKTFGPIINRKTSEYLSGLTGQAGETLRVNGNFDVQITDPATMSYKEHEFFSGGKIDQIYLALRLAVTDTVYTGQGEEGLPLFLDDILVQYDIDRGQRAVDFLIGMNREQKRQIFFFTCHEQIKKYCLEKGCHATDL